ncbi:tripartite tricarboxylate transporter TctB family protein [Limnohabitans sp.]|jgi:putative tricarboxylic transport membrane protein|uniref:tripartite tricarboxylate transporter TctB family protein n=1 Tax=Limnohabitans sp. TaxID=1907725 RepID=UPI0037BF3267
MKINDAFWGALFMALGAAVLWAVRDYPNIPGQPVGPALFPGLIAMGLCLAGAILLWQGWRKRTEAPWLVWEAWVHSPRHRNALAVLLGSVVFYIAVSERLGFFLTAACMMLALFRALQLPWRKSVFWAVLATLAVHFAFYKLLRVNLPWGVLTPIAW